jgi:hypothetical protein
MLDRKNIKVDTSRIKHIDVTSKNGKIIIPSKYKDDVDVKEWLSDDENWDNNLKVANG